MDSGGATITGLSCASARLCWAVDNHGDAIGWNGSTWSQPMAIDALRATKAATQQGPVVVLDAAVSPSLTGVSCGTPTTCVAVDSQGNAITWAGGSWGSPEAIEPGITPLTAVSCNFEPACVAVDGQGNVIEGSGDDLLVERGEGMVWSQPKLVDRNGGFTSVSCPSPYFCQAVDSHGYAVAQSGALWSSPSQIDAAQGLTSVSCPSVSACTAVDSAGDELTWSAGTWSAPTSTGGGSGASVVSCGSSSNCDVADGQGDVLQGAS